VSISIARENSLSSIAGKGRFTRTDLSLPFSGSRVHPVGHEFP
jgi:hypothetical protein